MFFNLVKIVSVTKSVAKLEGKSIAKSMTNSEAKSTCLYSIFYLLINASYLIILNKIKLQYIM